MAFAQRGAKVAVSDVSLERAEAVVAELVALGTPAFAVRVDVTNEDDLRRLRDEAVRRFDHIDVIMNNVGVLALGAPESMPDEAWRRVFDINLFSIARSNRVFLPMGTVEALIRSTK